MSTCVTLNHRKNDSSSASKRLANYIAWRQKLFGNYSSQSVTESPVLQSQIETLFFRVLPNRLPTGEGVIYLELKRHQPSEYCAEDTVRTWHYVLLSTLRKHPDLARTGFIILGNMTDAGYGNIDLGVPEAIATAVSNCMPIRMCKLFFVNPPFVLQMVLPVLKLILSSKLGERIVVITDLSTLYSEHSLDPLYLPEAVGGEVTEDTSAHHMRTLVADRVSV